MPIAKMSFVKAENAPRVTRQTQYAKETEKVKAALDKIVGDRVLVITMEEEGSKAAGATMARHLRADLPAAYEVQRVKNQLVIRRKKAAPKKKAKAVKAKRKAAKRAVKKAAKKPTTSEEITATA